MFRRAVLMGVPLRGTLLGIELMLADGHPLFGFAREIWSTLRSFTCIYEMLPTYPGAFLAPDPGADRSATIFQPESWPAALVEMPPESAPIRAGFLRAAGEVVAQHLWILRTGRRDARPDVDRTSSAAAARARPAPLAASPRRRARPRSVSRTARPVMATGSCSDPREPARGRHPRLDLPARQRGGGHSVAAFRCAAVVAGAAMLHMALPIIPAVRDRTAQFLNTGE